MDKNVTVMQAIVEDVATELYQLWYNSVPAEQRTEESSKAMAKNASETTFFVVQKFMDKFNAEAENLKSVDKGSEI
jgi:hypothetical protein